MKEFHDYEEGFMLLDEDVDFYQMLAQSCQRHLQGVHGLNGDVEFFFRVGGMEESPIEMTIQQAYQGSIRNQSDVFILVQQLDPVGKVLNAKWTGVGIEEIQVPVHKTFKLSRGADNMGDGFFD